MKGGIIMGIELNNDIFNNFDPSKNSEILYAIDFTEDKEVGIYVKTPTDSPENRIRFLRSFKEGHKSGHAYKLLDSNDYDTWLQKKISDSLWLIADTNNNTKERSIRSIMGYDLIKPLNVSQSKFFTENFSCIAIIQDGDDAVILGKSDDKYGFTPKAIAEYFSENSALYIEKIEEFENPDIFKHKPYVQITEKEYPWGEYVKLSYNENIQHFINGAWLFKDACKLWDKICEENRLEDSKIQSIGYIEDYIEQFLKYHPKIDTENMPIEEMAQKFKLYMKQFNDAEYFATKTHNTNIIINAKNDIWLKNKYPAKEFYAARGQLAIDFLEICRKTEGEIVKYWDIEPYYTFDEGGEEIKREKNEYFEICNILSDILSYEKFEEDEEIKILISEDGEYFSIPSKIWQRA